MFGRLLADERGIEGLPVRLIIAFVVGVATLGVLLQMVSGVGSLATSELDAKPTPDVVGVGHHTFDVAVVDSSGSRVADATVVVTSGTARVDHTIVAHTNETGVAVVDADVSLAPNQGEGTLDIEIKPPAGSKFVDRRTNTEILVIRGA